MAGLPGFTTREKSPSNCWVPTKNVTNKCLRLPMSIAIVNNYCGRLHVQEFVEKDTSIMRRKCQIPF